MAKQWSTVKFICEFMYGEIGRKRVHGTYRVLDGDHCQVLVKARTRYGRPEGSEVIAIRMNYDDYPIAFFHNHNTNCFNYSMNRGMDMYSAPRLPNDILHDGDQNILASGVVAVSGADFLIEIGDKPYLFHAKVKDGGFARTWDGGNATGGRGVLSFESVDVLPKRVASVEEAHEQTKDPEGMEILVNTWWAEQMPDGFRPPQLEDEYIAVLSKPVNPLDYGYRIDECGVTGSSSSFGGYDKVLSPHEKMLNGSADSRATAYLAAVKAWDKACRAVENHRPIDYKGLTVKKERYSYSSRNDNRNGTILSTSGGVFVQGQVTSAKDWDDTTKLDNWWKLYKPVSRIKL